MGNSDSNLRNDLNQLQAEMEHVKGGLRERPLRCMQPSSDNSACVASVMTACRHLLPDGCNDGGCVTAPPQELSAFTVCSAEHTSTSSACATFADTPQNLEMCFRGWLQRTDQKCDSTGRISDSATESCRDFWTVEKIRNGLGTFAGNANEVCMPMQNPDSRKDCSSITPAECPAGCRLGNQHTPALLDVFGSDSFQFNTIPEFFHE